MLLDWCYSKYWTGIRTADAQCKPGFDNFAVKAKMSTEGSAWQLKWYMCVYATSGAPKKLEDPSPGSILSHMVDEAF